MAILEKIRNRSLILILVIGLSLFAFVISGVFSKGNTGVKSSVGEVNGESISRDEFAQKVESSSRMMGSASTVQVVNMVWNQEVRQRILDQQFENLGINIEKDQILEVVKANPAFAQDPNFLNEAGVFDENKFIDFIYQLKTNNPAAYAQWQQQEDMLIGASKEQSYFNLVKAGVGTTLKEGELAYHIENDKVDIKYVKVPYTSVPDSTITISDSEIEAYVKEHKKEFEQEASRDIRYVFFSEAASEADKQAAKESLEALMTAKVEFDETTKGDKTIPGFAETTDVEDFVNAYSDVKFDSTYVVKSALPAALADTLFNLNAGEVYGPYLDGQAYKLTRMLDKKDGGAVKASHILISFDGSSASPKESRTKEEAEKLANELLAKVKANPSELTQLAAEYSDDPGSATRGGTYDNITQGTMVPAFNDYIFGNAKGSVGLVETDFGYHVIRVDDTYPAVKLATIVRKIEASEETISNVFTETTKFEMAVVEGGDFAELANTSDFAVRPVNGIKAMDENLPGLRSQRSLVQWTFNEETSVGDVKRFSTPDGYVVAQLTARHKAGLATARDAAPQVRPILRNRKKAAQIIAANEGKSMADVAKNNNVNVASASGLTLKNPTIAGAGREPMVVGIAFATDQGSTSSLIEGENGVFMVEVTSKNLAPSLDNYSTYANAQKTLNRNRVLSTAYQALRDEADVVDDRAFMY
ncbi:peptidylprolyl isomerase [Robertkochia solimangrovi]|uniref:peptidylprolyl isomerase n=1 Tax=Robertkochia solimangrovi TaxID=2213046 RepID=UPI00117F97E3|nr:peptidylprolyl isomerase [Robertkochia solimangrovi]TRZ43252.1 peptidylprolyl isomerase [Robertkochia solimangrovi]